jgi:alpha-L-fucosidase
MFLRRAIACVGLAAWAVTAWAAAAERKTYQPTWNSLKQWTVPQWLRDGKFGIYTHWGVYSVPAQRDKNLLFRGRREFPLQPLNLPI